MLPFVVILGQNLSGAFYSLFSRGLMKRLPGAQVQITAFFFTVPFLTVLPFLYETGSVRTSDLTVWWPYFMICGFATALNALFNLLVLRYMDAAMATLMTTINIVMAVVAAMYVLREDFGLQHMIGASIVLAAIIFALSVHVSRNQRHKWHLGIFFAVLSGIFFAIAVVIEKHLLGQMPFASYVTWCWGWQTVVILTISCCFGRAQYKKLLKLRHMPLLLGGSLSRIGMWMLFGYSILVLKSLCFAVVLAGLRPLFVSLLGAVFLKEREFLKRKIICSIAAAVGVAVMFW